MRTTIPMTLYRGASSKDDICEAECVTIYSQEELDAALECGFVDYFAAISGVKPSAEVPQQEQEVAKKRGRPRKEENAR